MNSWLFPIVLKTQAKLKFVDLIALSLLAFGLNFLFWFAFVFTVVSAARLAWS